VGSALAAIVATGVIAAGGATRAQDRPSPAGPRLILEAEKPGVVLGEPVYVTVRLANAGPGAAEVFRVLDPQAGTIRVEIATPARPRLVFLPLFYADVAGGLVSLASGQELAAVIPIFYGGLKWTFPDPGTYVVTASYRRRGPPAALEMQSNRVAISVDPGDGAGRFLMEDSRVGEEAGKFLLWQQGDHLRHGIAHLTNLVSKFPDSPVSDYVRLSLGRNLSRVFRDYFIGRAREQDCTAALAHLSRVRSDRLPMYLRIQAGLDEARCLQASGNPGEAADAFDRARRLSQGRREYDGLFDQATRLEPALGVTR
jgi:hypothetical protein